MLGPCELGFQSCHFLSLETVETRHLRHKGGVYVHV